MKKTLLALLLCCTSMTINSQISGVQAPDFTVTDINGNTHTLSTYLAQGKTVILDISATWCGPCWNFHNGHALEDLYNSYGPNGSDDLVVLFVEGDAQTTSADLNGTGNNTQGNWVAGTPYPIIDSGAIADLYGITFFPSLFRICPTGIVTNINTGSVGTLRNNLNSNCGTMPGAQNHGKVEMDDLNSCSTSVAPIAKIKNYGINSITSATLSLKENGTVIATKNYAGSLTMYNTANVTFNALDLNSTSQYEVEISNINNTTPFNNILTNEDVTFNLASNSSLQAQVRVYTDNYPTEIRWRIKNGAGTIVASGGPYAGSANGGGADANTTKIHNVTLADATDCYSVELLDSYGDGWGYGSTPHGLEIFNGENSILNISVANFGASLNRAAAFKTTSSLSINENEIAKISMLPNPSNGIFTLTTEILVDVEIYDITGKKVFAGTNLDNNTTININQLNSGLYLAKVTGDNYSDTIKLIIK
jgi:hypothetical protein